MKCHERKDKRGKTLKALRFLFVYAFAIFLGIFFLALRILGRIKVEHPERFPKGHRRLVVVSNHPSAFEPWLLVGVFFSEYIFHPIFFIPYIVPDQKLFKRWFLYPMWDRMIFVPRGNIRGELRVLALISLVLLRHRRVIIFPEGGRTGRGTKEEMVYSKEKKIPLRVLKHGIGNVALNVGTTVVPVWISGSDKVLPIGAVFPRLWEKTVIRWGNPVLVCKYRGKHRKEIAKQVALSLQQNLLELADE